MTSPGRPLMIAILALTLARPAQANNLQTDVDLIVTGIVVTSAAVGVAVTLLIIHHKHAHATISGCLTSGANGMSLTDDKDKRTYRLTGNPVAGKTGERMTLEGKRRKESGSPVFEARSITKDLGACQP